MTATPRHEARLDEVYRAHGDALHRICLARLGNAADAEDAVQETLLRAWKALPTYDAERPLRPWLATIARNVCNDTHRRRLTEERRRTYECDVADDAVEPLLAAERRTVVREALRSLPPRAATVLYLRDVEGWDYDRIGDHVDARPGAARTAVTRAREQMRERVKAVAVRKDHWPLAGLFGGILARRRVPVVPMAARPVIDGAAAAPAIEIGGRVAAAVALAAAAALGVGTAAADRADPAAGPPSAPTVATQDESTLAPTSVGGAPVSPARGSTRGRTTPVRSEDEVLSEPVAAVIELGDDVVAPVVAEAPALARGIDVPSAARPLVAAVDPALGPIDDLVGVADAGAVLP